MKNFTSYLFVFYIISYCTSLSNIKFNGTIAKWKAIAKGNVCHYKVSKTTVVTYTYGTTSLD